MNFSEVENLSDSDISELYFDILENSELNQISRKWHAVCDNGNEGYYCDTFYTNTLTPCRRIVANSGTYSVCDDNSFGTECMISREPCSYTGSVITKYGSWKK